MPSHRVLTNPRFTRQTIKRVWGRLTDFIPQSQEWWAKRAMMYDGGMCPKCNGLTRAFYHVGHDAMGECGVIESCVLCGWETVRVAGRMGVPLGDSGQ